MKNIIETARDVGTFNTLLAAVEAAGLTDTLANEGPFTVFAPNDSAFGKIPRDQLNSIINNKDVLTSILMYHVVSGKMMASDLEGRESVTTLQGGPLHIDTSRGAVRVEDARVIQADVECTNGVCHIIDSVLVPKMAEIPVPR
jgi:uncharacterized surface protein with fasciclin (FAS1) repeats